MLRASAENNGPVTFFTFFTRTSQDYSKITLRLDVFLFLIYNIRYVLRLKHTINHIRLEQTVF